MSERHQDDPWEDIRGHFAARAAVDAQHQQERQALDAEIATLRAQLATAQQERDTFEAAFVELHATVQGECSSLLDPDRGGSDVLWSLCANALALSTPAPTPQEPTT